MRISVAAEQRAPAPRNTNMTMLAYQEPPLWRDGYKAPTVGHIPGPSKKGRPTKPKNDFSVPAPCDSREDRMAAAARQAKTRQIDRCKRVMALYDIFDRDIVAEALCIPVGSAKHALIYWKKLDMIEDSGARGPSGNIVWREKKEGQAAPVIPAKYGVAATKIGAQTPKWTFDQHRARCESVFRGDVLDSAHIMDRMQFKSRRAASNQAAAWTKLGLLTKDGKFWRMK